MGTPIQGKIFPMYNKETGANRERRFPITVMEAVLGLPSYLQDQFSALADIYMPIEGISEAFTGQEFVYRKSPNTIKAKSLTLDRIKGKSLVWNQLVVNGDFSNGTTGWNVSGGSLSASNNILTWNNCASALYQPQTFITTHKYVVKADIKCDNQFGLGAGGSTNSRTYSASPNAFKTVAHICSNPVESNTVFVYPQDNTLMQFKNFGLIDLTILYGTEIDGMTDAEILAKYEADFGTGYHEYNAGKLISNDAESIETTGANVWDEEGELGTFINGEPVSSSTRFRSKNFCECIGNESYYLCGIDYGTGVDISWYDSGQNFISKSASGWGSIVTAPATAAYFKICVWAGTTYNHDICINLSDESINGQYFPYWKRTLNLGLNSFKVKDSQGNITTITGGLKSAGSVYDEIVGNKYIKRVGSVDLGSLSYERTGSNRGTFFTPPNDCIRFANNDFPALYPNIICAKYPICTLLDCYYNKPDKSVCLYTLNNRSVLVVKDSSYTDSAPTAQEMSGVMLYYELTSPIEYDLVEPLIYTMKAGTTEARISPNEDGLSAPFCCDMTYSASDNNDADNAQYAATAGRLLNTRKIWGQDFNGSEDVDGNLVSNGILQGTQLKSTVPTGTAPLVVSSTTTVANLVAEKASKLLTARTIWGQNFDGSGDISGAISNITTISASGLATLAGGIALGTSTNAQAARLVWDETNNAWHLQGNLYADGSISAKGTINNNTDYVTRQQYNELVSRIEALEG